MLTDYHLHLRPDDLDASADEYFARPTSSATAARPSERGIAELGVSEHVYRFEQALDIWQHPFWVPFARDDLDAYCAFVREQTDLRLGIEADFVPGAEDRTANLLQARDFDYVVGSVHFIRDGAVDMDDYSVWDSGRSVEQIWQRYFETIGESARSGLFDVLAHPDLVKVWGAERPLPEGDLRRYYEPAIEGIAESGIAVEVSTAGPAQARQRALSGAGVSGDVPGSRRADRAVQRRPPTARTSAPTTTARWSCSASSASSELCVFEHRQRRLEPIGADETQTGEHAASASAMTPIGSQPGAGWSSAACRSSTSAASTVTPTPTCSPTP